LSWQQQQQQQHAIVGAVVHGMRLLRQEAAVASVYNMFVMLQVGFRLPCAAAFLKMVL
jgi:hypothetical protein